MKGRRFVRVGCSVRLFRLAGGRHSWSLRLPRVIRGRVVVSARAVDGAGNRSRVALRKAVLR